VLDQLNILLKELEGWGGSLLLQISNGYFVWPFLITRMIVPDAPNVVFPKPRAFVPDHPMVIGETADYPQI
jgi:hypothetical protein